MDRTERGEYDEIIQRKQRKIHKKNAVLEGKWRVYFEGRRRIRVHLDQRRDQYHARKVIGSLTCCQDGDGPALVVNKRQTLESQTVRVASLIWSHKQKHAVREQEPPLSTRITASRPWPVESSGKERTACFQCVWMNSKHPSKTGQRKTYF